MTSSSRGPVVLLHNPRCSKSRAALAHLEARQHPHRVRLYLEEPLSREELDELARRLGGDARGLVRLGDALFAEAGGRQDDDASSLLDLLAREPRLMQRPVVDDGREALIARPPASLDDWLDG
jgi:arsenate reductase